MLFRRKGTSSSLSTGIGSSLLQQGRPASAGSNYSNGSSNTKCVPIRKQSNSKLFRPGVKILVHRAPLLAGLSCSSETTGGGLYKPFQRPMIKRRAYGKQAEDALKRSSLGQRRRFDGMAKLLARAGKGLTYKLPSKDSKNDSDTGSESDSDMEDKNKEPDRPFEPLMVWQSPHQGGEPKGLEPRTVTEMRPDEYGVDEEVRLIRPAPLTSYNKESVFVPPVLAKWLRPHQREGVFFMYQCVMGLKQHKGQGCILADDMGLGKTLQSVCLIYTLIKTGITANRQPTAKRVIVVCPCSLVKNWDNEFIKWLGPGGVKTMALSEGDRKTMEKNIDCFVKTRMFTVLIASYECIRTHAKRFTKYPDCCDLLVCDEAHRLKNSENQTSRALNSLPVRRRVLLTGTPMQNDLQEFYAMVDFTNPGILGTAEEFRRKMLFPILRGREPDATERQKAKMMQIQNDMSLTVNEFILRRVNTVNAQHLPPKLVQVVCCKLTDIQQNMYQHLVNSKDMQHVLDGKQVNCLSSIQMLMKLTNHPSLVATEDTKSMANKSGRRSAAQKNVKYCDDEPSTAAPGADGIAKFLPYDTSGGGHGRGSFAPVHPEWSGKMFVLYRLMKEMRKPGNGADKIVIVSNYTQTLDLIGRMCRESNWGFCRLDGSISMKKRQKMVDEFNDPCSSLIAFLLSSKAGGCGLNLIGGNRLVLFDPDWNPAVDKQAAARCWRDGQKKRCFTYRFLGTGTVEEKIFQRQLSKEGLQSVVDDKEQVNELSTKDLKNLFKLRQDTPSDTHDKLKCSRCKIIQDNAEMQEAAVLPKKLAACQELLDIIMKKEDAIQHFLKPLQPMDYDCSKENYEQLVKQPMDFGTIHNKLIQPPGHSNAYKSVSSFSKDVNRIFSNVAKVWGEGDEICAASRRLQAWWVEQWKNLVPQLMTMKAGSDVCKTDPKMSQEDVHTLESYSTAATGNERSDDCQEQIGMPDEENMRHWSHHHTTDSVDDPVFRAAMRGCDAVSFVFGLEVTWSLIQQRQQEEEERFAMQELENMDDDEEHSDNEGEEAEPMEAANLKPANGGVSPCNDSSTVAKGATEEQESGGDGTSIENVQGEESSDGDSLKEIAGDFSSENDDSDNSQEVIMMDLEESESEDEDSVDEQIESMNDEEESATEDTDGDDEDAQEESVKGDQEEESGAEDSDEEGDDTQEAAMHDEHEVDGGSNHHFEKSPNGLGNDSPTGTSNQGTPVIRPGEWACPRCTFINKKMKRKCSTCGAKKP